MAAGALTIAALGIVWLKRHIRKGRSDYDGILTLRLPNTVSAIAFGDVRFEVRAYLGSNIRGICLASGLTRPSGC
jgi:hypothetical protein